MTELVKCFLYHKGPYSMYLVSKEKEKGFLDQPEIHILYRDMRVTNVIKAGEGDTPMSLILAGKKYIDNQVVDESQIIKELEDRIQGLEAELDTVLDILYKNSSEHLGWIKANFPNFRRFNE